MKMLLGYLRGLSLGYIYTSNWVISALNLQVALNREMRALGSLSGGFGVRVPLGLMLFLVGGGGVGLWGFGGFRGVAEGLGLGLGLKLQFSVEGELLGPPCLTRKTGLGVWAAAPKPGFRI